LLSKMVKGLTQRLNFSFVTEHNEKTYGVIPKGNEGHFSWDKSEVYEIISEDTHVKVIGPIKSQIINKYLDERLKIA